MARPSRSRSAHRTTRPVLRAEPWASSSTRLWDRSTATSRTSRAASTGPSPTRRCIRSPTTSRARSAPTSWGGGCTKCSSSGRASSLTDQPPFVRDFAEIWRAADKIVYSKTLEVVSSARTRIEREFDPEAVRELKAAAERDLTIGGPELAAHAFRAGLVDECHLFLAPILVGGGKRFPPRRFPPETRTAGRTPVRQRRGPPPLPHGPQRLIADAGSRLPPRSELDRDRHRRSRPRSDTPRPARRTARVSRAASPASARRSSGRTRTLPSMSPVHSSSPLSSSSGNSTASTATSTSPASVSSRLNCRRPRTETSAGRVARRQAAALPRP